jgi:hypothetical protein
MSDTKQFLDAMMPRIHMAETALHNGDAAQRRRRPALRDVVAHRSGHSLRRCFQSDRVGRGRSDVREARVELLELQLVRVGSGCRRRRRRLRISARDRTDDRVGRRLRTDAVHAPQHDNLPARERRVEDRASPCRSDRRLRRVALAFAPQPMKATAQIRAVQERLCSHELSR